MVIHKKMLWFNRILGGSSEAVVIHKKMCWFIRILGGSSDDVVVHVQLWGMIFTY